MFSPSWENYNLSRCPVFGVHFSRRLARDYERLTETRCDFHWVAALTLFLITYFQSA